MTNKYLKNEIKKEVYQEISDAFGKVTAFGATKLRFMEVSNIFQGLSDNVQTMSTEKEENKQLLLQDLCARLSCGVMMCTAGGIVGKLDEIDVTDGQVKILQRSDGSIYWERIENIFPFLRPMSSMTKEEKKEQYKFSTFSGYQYVDWLNKHHFDYRGLIDKGLAWEAPEYMYNF